MGCFNSKPKEAGTGAAPASGAAAAAEPAKKDGAGAGAPAKKGAAESAGAAPAGGGKTAAAAAADKALKTETNIKKFAKVWSDYLNSQEFEKHVSNAFDRCRDASQVAAKERQKLGLGADDDTLNITELEAAIASLTELLDEKVGGRLPPPADSKACAKLLAEFDEDGSGTLDAHEFQRFARIYFARLEWPLWKEAMRGVGMGVVAAWVVSYPLPVVMAPVIEFLKPIIIDKMKEAINKALKESFLMQKQKMSIMFKDGNPFNQDEEDKRQLRRLEFNAKLAKFGGSAIAMGAAGAGAAAVGIL